VLIFGERFGPTRIAGIALVLLSLAIIVVPERWAQRLRFTLDRTQPSR
jgi:drug/metabolite transporter (DMT)-like permease